MLALLQAGFVFYGFLGTKVCLNFREKIDFPLPVFSEMFATFGLFLILIPVSWLVLIMILEKKEMDWSEGVPGLLVATFVLGTLTIVAILSVRAVYLASAFLV